MGNYQRQFLHGTMKHQYSNRPRYHKKPEIYMWEKIFVIDHDMMHVPNLARRNRWFQMCKISHLGKEHFHPEFKKYDEERQRYLPKGFREPWQRKRGMGRRYYRYLPKLKIPLEEDSGPFPTSVCQSQRSTWSQTQRGRGRNSRLGEGRENEEDLFFIFNFFRKKKKKKKKKKS